jgi:hypothetical protein
MSINDSPAGSASHQWFTSRYCFKIENDPDGEDRILVQNTYYNALRTRIWARVASLMLEKIRGAFFLDQRWEMIITGFDDPNQA